MSRTKVLHITQSLGGVQSYLEQIFEYADPQRYKFIIAAPKHTEFQEFCKQRDVTYLPINIRRSCNPIRDFITLVTLIFIIKKEKPDVVHTHSAKGGFLGRLAAKLTDRKVIFTPHAFSYLAFTGIKRVFFFVLEHIAKRWTDLLLAVSYSEANRAHFDLAFPKNKVNVCLNSIHIAEDELRRDYDRCMSIGMIGRLTYQKNPLLFIEIAHRLTYKYPNLRFSILGAGLHDHLINEISYAIKKNQLEEKVDFERWGDHNTTEEFLKKTDIYLMTSLFEGLPYSLLEAMSKGIPCVVSKADGNVDVIQNGENGFACLSVDTFCEKIELLINSTELREKIGKAGFSYVKTNHDIKDHIHIIENIYSRLAARKQVEVNNNYAYLFE